MAASLQEPPDESHSQVGVSATQGLLHSCQAPSRKFDLKKRNRKSVLGDFEKALVVCLKLWVKVGVGPGPIPAPPPHKRQEKYAPSRMQKGGERGPEASGWLRGALRMVRGVCTTGDPNPSCARQWRYTTQLSERFGRKSRLGPPAIPS